VNSITYLCYVQFQLVVRMLLPCRKLAGRAGGTINTTRALQLTPLSALPLRAAAATCLRTVHDILRGVALAAAAAVLLLLSLYHTRTHLSLRRSHRKAAGAWRAASLSCLFSLLTDTATVSANARHRYWASVDGTYRSAISQAPPYQEAYSAPNTLRSSAGVRKDDLPCGTGIAACGGEGQALLAATISVAANSEPIAPLHTADCL